MSILLDVVVIWVVTYVGLRIIGRNNPNSYVKSYKESKANYNYHKNKYNKTKNK